MCVRLCRCLCVRLSGLDALGATALHGAPCACLACVHDRRNAQVTAAPDSRILDGEIALDAADGEAAGVELDEALSRVEGPETQTQGRPLMRLMQAERVDFVLQAGVDS